MSPLEKAFREWVGVDVGRWSLQDAFYAGFAKGIGFANDQLEPDLCKKCLGRLRDPNDAL
jgi:hypothetical protein